MNQQKKTTKKISAFGKALLFIGVLGVLLSVMMHRPSLGFMADTAANRRKAASAFQKALQDNPNQKIVKVYVFTRAVNGLYCWQFFQYDREAHKAYFGPRGKGSPHSGGPPMDRAYLGCLISEERVQAKLQEIVDYPYGTDFFEAFRTLDNNLGNCP